MKCALLSSLILVGLARPALADHWTTSQHDDLLEISYATASGAPQYAALHLKSGYFRMNYGPGSGWGTSVVLMPSYWRGGNLFQGYPVTATAEEDGADLVLHLSATSNSLQITGTVRISPPKNEKIVAKVDIKVDGDEPLDRRSGEAFKPVMLSSMHESDTSWDASTPYVGSQPYTFPAGGWIVQPNPDAKSKAFGLLGGTSAWKTNSPTVKITLGKSMMVGGWVTNSNNPNDDNVGFWAGSDEVLSSWSYKIEVSSADQP